MKKPKRINSVSVGLAIIFALVVYAGYAFIPVLWPLWQMSGIMRTACAVAYNEPDTEVIMKRLLRDARRTRLRVTEENFRFERTPYSEEEILDAKPYQKDRMKKIGKECTVRFRYVTSYKLPIIGIEYTLPYESAVSQQLTKVNPRTNPLYEFFYNSCTCTSVPSAR